jgi:hypothetical protein
MPVVGSSHEAGSKAEALGSAPVTYWVGPDSGETATTYE